jgi:oligosaccharide repeat unit polymerase
MVLLCILVLTILWVKKSLRSAADLHPTFFIPLVSLIQIGIPVVVYLFVPNIHLYDWGVEVLCLFVLLFQLGAWIIIRIKPLNTNSLTLQPHPFAKKSVKKLLIFGYVGSMIGLVMSAKSTFDYASLDISIDNLLKLAGINSVVRYEQEDSRTAPLAVFLFNTFYYFSAFFSGIFLSYSLNYKERALAFFCIILGLIESLFQGAKMVVLVVMMFMAIGYCIMNIYCHQGRYMLITPQRIKSFLLGGGLIVAIFYFVNGVRYYDEAQGVSLEVGTQVGSAFFGHVAAFSVWYQQFDYDKLELGFYNFGGIYSQLGLKERSVGIYSDSIFVSPSWDTNVYTVYRGILQDFNVFSYALMLIVGMLTSWLYGRVRDSFDILGVIGLSMIYLYFFWAHVTSLLNYNIIVLSLFCISIGLLYLKGHLAMFFKPKVNKNNPT